MKSSMGEILPILGTSMGGGFYGGRVRIDGLVYALIVAPKADGENKGAIWIKGNKEIAGARSYEDGLANTRAMAEAGSKLAKWALDLRIAGNDDWYLPAQDELEVLYRNLKPTTHANWCYARSGINLSAVEPTRPYTPALPVQTLEELFKAGGDQAFEYEYYWSSTAHASVPDCAWLQGFDDGIQHDIITLIKFRARAVRRLEIQ